MARKAASTENAAATEPVDAGTSSDATGAVATESVGEAAAAEESSATAAADTDTSGTEQTQAPAGTAGADATAAAATNDTPSVAGALGTAMYPVLTPFKFRGHVVKPPTFLELTAKQAKPYQDAKVLGTEASAVPTVDDDEA